MSKICLCLALLLSGALVPGSAFCVGKTTVDPNSSPTRATQPIAAPDLRLEQKVTYDGGYKRLHQVVAELTTSTGVAITCGANKHDWQVRDIPVIVCTKDLPLGLLLRSLAHTTHCSLRSEPSVDGKTVVYRITRSKGVRDEIAASVDEKRAAGMADIQWKWDVLTRLGSLNPDQQRAAIEKNPSLKETLPLARLVSALGPEGRAKVLSGESLRVDAYKSQAGALVRDWYRERLARVQMPQTSTGDDIRASMPTADDADDLSMVFRLDDAEGTSPPGVAIAVHAVRGTPERSHVVSMSADLSVPDLRGLEGLELPPRPERKEAEQADAGLTSDGMKPLQFDADLPALKAKVTLEQTKDGKQPTRADRVSAIAQASGWSIICEDFESHRSKWRPSGSGGITYSYALNKPGAESGLSTSASILSELTGLTWSADEQGKLIVGCANDWRERHANLVPASLVDALKRKLDGPGVDLEDVLPLFDLRPAQRWEWVYGSVDLGALRAARFASPDAALWKLYAKLSRGDRALAQSEAGLPLGKFDPAWLVRFIRDARRTEPDSSGISTNSRYEEPRDGFRRDYLSDPTRIGSLTMRLIRNERPHSPAPAGGASADQAEVAVFYTLQLTADDDERTALGIPGPCEFPVTRATGDGAPVMPTITSPFSGDQRQYHARERSSAAHPQALQHPLATAH